MSCVSQSMKDALKNHVLEEVLPQTGDFRAFYLKEPGHGRMMSTLFVFTPEGIVIMGDLCPGGPKNQGSISNYGYGLSWFASELSEGYLCSKFLREEWQPEVALEWLKGYIADVEKGDGDGGDEEKEKLEAYKEIQASLEGGDMDFTRFHDALEDTGFYVEDEGCAYPKVAAGWLCALQQRFAELYSLAAREKQVTG